MAEFNYYGVAEDMEGIFCSLSERGDLKFIPERSYPTAEYFVLKGVRTETERSLSQNRWLIYQASAEHSQDRGEPFFCLGSL